MIPFNNYSYTSLPNPLVVSNSIASIQRDNGQDLVHENSAAKETWSLAHIPFNGKPPPKSSVR